MGWATLSPTVKIGIVLSAFVVIIIILVGAFTQWKFRCYQRLPATGQNW